MSALHNREVPVAWTEPPTGLLQVSHVGGHSTPLHKYKLACLVQSYHCIAEGSDFRRTDRANSDVLSSLQESDRSLLNCCYKSILVYVAGGKLK